MCAPSPQIMDDGSVRRNNLLPTSTLGASNDSYWTASNHTPEDISSLQDTDSKDWAPVAPDVLHPKLLRELRGDVFPEDGHQSWSSKGGSRAKAWVRRSPIGFVLRLQQKISEKIEMVIDTEIATGKPRHQPSSFSIHHPDSARQILHTENRSSIDKDTSHSFPDSASSTMDSGLTALHEAPDNAVIPEIGSDPIYPIHELSAAESILPPYEAISRVTPAAEHEKPARSNEQPGLIIRATSDGPVSPILGESSNNALGRVSQDSIDDLFTPEDVTPPQLPSGESSDAIAVLEAHLDQTRSELREEKRVNDEAKRQLQQEIQNKQAAESLLEDLQQRLSKREGGKLRSDANQIGGLRIVGQKRYEIETDIEPPSPSDTPDVRHLRSNSSALSLRRRRDPGSSKSLKAQSLGSSDEASDDNEDDNERTTSSTVTGTGKGAATRRRTGTKRLSATLNKKETLLTNVLRAQAEILGPEHRLTSKARLERPRNPREWESRRLGSLVAILREGGHEAKAKHGDDNARVKTFFADLRTFEELIRRPGPINVEAAVDKSEESGSSPNVSFKNEVDTGTQNLPVATKNSQLAERPQKPAGHTPLPTPISPSQAEKLAEAVPASPDDVTYEVTGNGGFMLPSRPYEPRAPIVVFTGLVLNALVKTMLGAFEWLQLNYGPEPQLESGKVRVRWTCPCGERLFDDYTELQPGAARTLEVFLNRPRVRTQTPSGGSPVSPGSTNSFSGLSGSSIGALSHASSWTTVSSVGQQPFNSDSKGEGTPSTGTTAPMYPSQYTPRPHPLYLLICASEDRYTTKMTHVDIDHVTSDMSLARAMREHYAHVNQPWWRIFRLRGLAAIEFVQFEVHRNRFADIRKCPDMPPRGRRDYAFDPVDLCPPMGSQLLLHMFKHPTEYDTELMASLRVPKKADGRLSLGVGWGLNLVEGFLAERIRFMVASLIFFAGLVFAIAWACERHDVQGAFGVAQWITSAAAFGCVWVQLYVG